MRRNAFGQIARDHRGAAVAHWLRDDGEYFQQPVDLTNPAGPWHQVVRVHGVVSEFRREGANFWAARAGQWLRRLDGADPLLAGSADWLPPDGRVGDVDHDGTILAISDDGLTMFVDGVAIHRGDVQGETRLVHGLLTWVSRGTICVFDTRTMRDLPVKQVGPGAWKAVAFRDSVGRAWVMYGTDPQAGVLHLVDDASRGYRFGTPLKIYAPEPHIVGDGVLLGWSSDEGEFFNEERLVPILGVGMVFLEAAPPELPPVPPPPPEPGPLAITITQYTESGVVPFDLRATYRVTGHRGPVEAMLTIDDTIVVGSDAAAGEWTYPLTKPGEYRIGAIATSLGRTAKTGAERIVRVTAPVPQHPGITMPTDPGSGNPDAARKPWADAASAAEREDASTKSED